MRKIFLLLTIVITIFGFNYNKIEVSAFNEIMEQDSLEKEMIRISETYDEGDILSEEDSKIVWENWKNNLNNPAPLAGYSSKKFTISDTQFGVKATFSGTMSQDIAVVAGMNEYRGNVKLTTSKAVSKATLYTYHTSYGVLAWNGTLPSIGVLYKGNVKHSSSNTSNFGMNLTERYNGVLPTYTTMYSKARIVTKTGSSFDVNSPNWTEWQ